MEYTKLDFFIAGAAKSGTTALYDSLQSHPQIFLPLKKEPHYYLSQKLKNMVNGPFDKEITKTMYIDNVEQYNSLFSDAEGTQILGEGSTTYLYDREACEAIKNKHPRAKVVIMLRNPIERAYSAFSHMHRDNREETDSFLNALNLEESRIKLGWMPIWHYKNMGFYSEQVATYLSTFGKENVHIMLFERYIRNIDSEIINLLNFLNVDSSIKVNKVISNESNTPKNKYLHSFLKKNNFVKSLCKPFISANVRKKLIHQAYKFNKGGKIKLNESDRTSLVSTYASDVAELKLLLNDRIEEWKEFV
jgi:hypothetical protein